MPGCRPRWRCPARPGFPAPPPAWCPSLPGCCRSGPPRAPAGWPLPSRAATPANRGTRPTAPSPPPSPPPAAMPVRPPSPRPFHPPERRGPVPPPPGSNPRCSRGRIRGPIWRTLPTWAVFPGRSQQSIIVSKPNRAAVKYLRVGQDQLANARLRARFFRRCRAPFVSRSLRGFIDAPQAPAPYARNDQVRAFRLRSAVRAHRRLAGLPPTGISRALGRREAGLDRGGHGSRALRRHGLQPPGGCRSGRPQPAHPHAPSARRPALSRFRLGIRRRFRRRLPVRRRAPQPALPAPGAARPGCRLLLFLHQALHFLFPPRARLLARHRSRRRLDRRGRLARPAHSLAHRRRHFLDRRLRRHLRLPGLRIRLRRSAGERSPSSWHLRRALGLPLPAPADDRLPARSGPLALARLPGAGRSRRRRGLADLRAQPCSRSRSVARRRRLLHHERLGERVILYILGRRYFPPSFGCLITCKSSLKTRILTRFDRRSKPASGCLSRTASLSIAPTTS